MTESAGPIRIQENSTILSLEKKKLVERVPNIVSLKSSTPEYWKLNDKGKRLGKKLIEEESEYFGFFLF